MARQIYSVGWNKVTPPPFAASVGASQSTADFRHFLVGNSALGKLSWFDGTSWSTPALIPTGRFPSGYSPVSQDGSSIAFYDGVGAQSTSTVIVCSPGLPWRKGVAFASEGYGSFTISGLPNIWVATTGGVPRTGTVNGQNPFFWTPDTPDYMWLTAAVPGFTNALVLCVAVSITSGQIVGAIGCDFRADVYLYQPGTLLFGSPAPVSAQWVPPGYAMYYNNGIKNSPFNAIGLSGFFGGGKGNLWFENTDFFSLNTNYIFTTNGASHVWQTPLVPHALVTGKASVGVPLYVAGTQLGWPVGQLSAFEAANAAFAAATMQAVRGPGGMLVPTLGGGDTLDNISYYQISDAGLITGGITTGLPAAFPAFNNNWGMGFIGNSPYLLDGLTPNLYQLSLFSGEYSFRSMANWSKRG